MEMDLEKSSREIKKDILRMFYHSKTGHLATAFSCVEILEALYAVKKQDDDIILSKGHGAAALYAVLAQYGIIEREMLGTFYDNHSKLLALASPTIPGIRIPTGSLGQGICYCTGLSLAEKMAGNGGFVYCVIGDGEMQEGSVWEAATFAVAQRLDNLVVILDHNQIQAGHKISVITEDYSVKDRWEGFHWNVIEVNGHDVNSLKNTIINHRETVQRDTNPTIIVAETIKGNGLPRIENEDDCHMKNPKGEEWWEEICKAFDITVEELAQI